ncbi:MAG: hypothetical protein HOW73_17735 [Polyangiaceae bacterium]|nr:hypothetical protein [Polyangiaceae bacterium]
MSARIFGTAFAVLTLLACGTGDIGTPPGTNPDDDEPETFSVEGLAPSKTRTYLEKLAPPLVGRVLTPYEQQQIEADGGKAIEPIVKAWATEPGLVSAARAMMEEKLSVSGETPDIDYSLPGNLVEHVVKTNAPWSDILTAPSCYGRDGNVVACDSGAPFTAGVLTTRGYLAARASRFNLTRSSTLLRAFACQSYPQDDSIQPRVPPEKLRHLFSITDLSQADPEEIASAANPDHPCHDCHGQFAAHAQLFVKFDQEGIYRPEATGEQDPDGELGRSFNGLMTSHFKEPADMASEKSQMFGTEVNNLAEAAHVLSDDPLFLQCSAQNLLEYTLRIDTAGPLGKTVDKDMLARIADTASAESAEPTFPEIVAATFTDPDVVRTVVGALAGDDE